MEFKLRPLTRRELKDLKKRGFGLNIVTNENLDDVIDEVFKIVLGADADKADDLPNLEARALFWEILHLTFTGAAEKNSSASGSGTDQAGQPAVQPAREEPATSA